MGEDFLFDVGNAGPRVRSNMEQGTICGGGMPLVVVGARAGHVDENGPIATFLANVDA